MEIDCSGDTPASRLATRLVFFIVGFGMSCWAPLVPYVKSRIGADEAELGLLLLCLGLGSVISMPLAAGLSGRWGCRTVLLLSSLGIAISLPILAFAPTVPALVFALLFFGASIGVIDVAANIHGTEVQNAAGVPLMSNFHGMYSVGGLAGAGAMTLMLAVGMKPLPATLVAMSFLFYCVWLSAPGLLRTKSASDAPFFVLPQGITLLIGMLAFIIFLVEGAMLDWSAVLLSEERQIPTDKAGIGYALFALAMTVGRLTGDRTIKRFGERKVLLFGSLLTTAGTVVLIFVPIPLLSLSGFLVIGYGAANLVPVLFTAAGSQKSMPKEFAIAAVSFMGYAGVLCGPAFVGFLAKATGLLAGFGVLGAAVLILALFSGKIGRINP